MRSMHAELVAVLNTNPKVLRGSTVYVAKLGKNGEPAKSKPCKGCIKMLKRKGVRVVHYTSGCDERSVMYL